MVITPYLLSVVRCPAQRSAARAPTMPKKLSPEERKRRLHNIRVAYRQAATKGTRQRGKHEVNGECKGHKDGLIYSLRQLNPVALCRDCLGLKNEYASNSDEYIAERRLHNKRRREQYAAMKRGQHAPPREKRLRTCKKERPVADFIFRRGQMVTVGRLAWNAVLDEDVRPGVAQCQVVWEGRQGMTSIVALTDIELQREGLRLRGRRVNAPGPVSPPLAPPPADECPVCLEYLNDSCPVLPCGHRFHAACVAEVAGANGGSKIACPACRQEFSRVGPCWGVCRGRT